MEPEVFFVFVMQAKCFGNLLTLFLLGVHLTGNSPLLLPECQNVCAREIIYQYPHL